MKARRHAFLAGAGAYAAIGIVRYPAGAAEFNYKLGLVNPATYPIAVRASQASAHILKDSGGRLDIKVFPFSQLGGNLQMVSQVRLGAVELLIPPDADLSTVVPVVAMTSLPFIVSNRDAALKLLSGNFGTYVRAAVAKAGLYQFPQSWDAGFRQIENAVRPISVVADMRGLKIRTSPSAAEIAAFKAFGATPTTIASSELYTALQTHLVDGATLPLDLVEPFKLYDVTKHLSRTNHLWAGQTMVANPDAWRRLPPNLQEMVERTFESARRDSNDDLPKLNAASESALQAHGMAFTNPDIGALRKVVRDAGLYTQWKNNYPPEAWALLEKEVGTLG